jgi:hypothetical protein
MFKRLAISFCLLAFAMLQAHNVIPHHHKEDHTAKLHHHHDDQTNDHDHHDGDGNKTVNHQFPFTDLTHNADFGKVVAKPQFQAQVLDHPFFSEGTLLQLYNKLPFFKSPPQPHPPDNDSSLHHIFLSHSLPLRAPPASSCLS